MRLTIRNKLFAGFGALLAISLVLSIVAISSLGSVHANASTLYRNAAAPLAQLAVARAKANEDRALLNDADAGGVPADRGVGRGRDHARA
jgi:hypothetical protein